MAAGPSHGADHGPDDVIANGHRPKDSVPPEVLPAEITQGEALPRFSTRGTAPGHRGCWALNRLGEPCGSARRADSDYCNAHSGYGVAADPKAWSAVAAERQGEIRRRRASLRATLGITRPNSPSGLLKAAVFAERERLVMAALDGALSPEVSTQGRAAAALKLIEVTQPKVAVSAEVVIPDNAEGVEALSLSQLLSIAEQRGIDL